MAEGFFLVWNPARNVPTVRHPTREAATFEAERLARQQPGDQFFVLRACTVSCIPQTPVATDPVQFAQRKLNKPSGPYVTSRYWWTP